MFIYLKFYCINITVRKDIKNSVFSGSPWKVAILDPRKLSVSGSGLEYVHVGRTAAFSLGLKDMDPKKLSVQILGNRDVVATSLDEMLARLLCNQFTIYQLLIHGFIFSSLLWFLFRSSFDFNTV